MTIEINSFVVLVVAIFYLGKTAYDVYENNMPGLMEAAGLYFKVLVLVVAVGAMAIGIPVHIR